MRERERDKKEGGVAGCHGLVRRVLGVLEDFFTLFSGPELQFIRQIEICFGQMLQMFRQPGL